MMELTCAFILISASLVIATPHGYGGYGVKGDASARAESGASAGAFPGIPVAVPLGAGYSGSFSKSSSSSSATSSASSSASSSSFSYSGSGAGGFGLHGGAPGHGGCSSGNCQNSGGNGAPTPHGSSAQGYNSANAAASAEAAAGAVSGLGCQGSSCDGNSEKCTSGLCKPGTPAIDSDSNKCTSGQCGSASGNGESPTDDGSNDIRAVTDSARNANHHSSGNDKTSSAYNGADSNCFNGKCGPSSSKPNHYGHGSGNSYQDSNNEQGSSSDIEITSHYQKPSTHLETPKESSKCNSGNCNAGLGEPGYGSSPSSYNVPIHGAYNKGEPKPSCDGVKCENQPKGSYSPTDNSVTKEPSSFDYPSSTNCVGSSCFGSPASQVTGGPSGTVRPDNDHFGDSSSHVPVVPGHIGHVKPSDANNKSPNDRLPPYIGGFGGPAGVLSPNDVPVTVNPNQAHANTPQSGKPLGSAPTGCNSPSCSEYPSGSGPTGGLAPTGTYNRPGGDIPSDKLPTYTGGFGGPAGTLKPSGFDVHATVTNKPSYAHSGSPSYNTQPAGNIGTPGCQGGGNCGGYSPTAGATPGASAPSGHYGTTKPNNDIHSPNDKLPTYTGGFGGPGGVFNPDKHDIQATGPSSPGYTPSGTYNTPSPSGHPGGCKTPNCYSSFSSTAATESIGVTKPITDVNTAAPNQPQYTGGFGGPSGALIPSEHNFPGCKTGNCANYPISGPSAGAHAQPGSFSVTKPNTDAAQNQPQYTGGFGGPSGTLKPSDHNSPGCNGGNCANYPISGPSAGANLQPGSFGVTKPVTDVNTAAPNQPQYTGGFGGPSGTLKPSGHSYVKPSTGSATTNCGTPNCFGSPSANAHAAAGAGANAQLGSYGFTKPSGGDNPSNEKPNYNGGFGGALGLLKPNDYNVPAVSTTPLNKPSGVPSPTACISGNCNPQAPHSSSPHAHNGASGGAHATAAAAAEANAVAYTGGFGGPPGVLAPFDDGKVGTLPTHGGQGHGPQIGGAHGSHNAYIHSQHGTIPGANGGPTGPAGAHGNTGAQAGSTAAAAAFAGAAAGATAGAHGFNPHGSYNHAGNVKGGSPCGSGCGGSGGGTYNGGSTLEVSAGPGFPKLVLSDGGGITSGGTGRSLAGANAFGLGGSFASSSASANAFAGAYTKGGYGKR